VRIEALAGAVCFAGTAEPAAPAAGATVLAVAEAIARHRRIRCEYVSHDGERSTRRLSPWALVLHGVRWYLVGCDHDRGDALRTFRADRVTGVELGGSALTAPDGFDAARHLLDSLAHVPWRWEVEVMLALPAVDAAARLPPAIATLESRGEGETLLRMRADTLEFAASVLGGLGCDFVVHRPDELRSSVRRLAARLSASADA
jgi:predicted DNA-binding transcriptional regulator YafY